MRNATAKLTFFTFTFNLTFNYKLHDDIKRRCIIFKSRSKPKVNIQSRWISLFSKSSWIKTTGGGLSYELGVTGEKKLMETGILLIKMEIAHFTLVNLEILPV